MNTYRGALLFLGLIWLTSTTDTANAAILLSCDGKPIRVSLELNYRWHGDGGLGVAIVPDLNLARDLAQCSFEALYQRLLNEDEIVVKHSTGARADTALIRPSGENDWEEVSDFNAVILEDGMRIWITLFNSPDDKPTKNEA